MSETKDSDRRPRTGIARSGQRLELRGTRTVESSTIRQSFSHGRSKQVAVEVRRRRTVKPPKAEPRSGAEAKPEVRPEPARKDAQPRPGPTILRPLTEEERRTRREVLAKQKQIDEEIRRRREEQARLQEELRRAEEQKREEEQAAAAPEVARQEVAPEEAAGLSEEEKEARRRAEEQAKALLEQEQRSEPAAAVSAPGPGLAPIKGPAERTKTPLRPETLKALAKEEEAEERKKKVKDKRPSLRKSELKEKRPLKLVLTEELEEEEAEAPPAPAPQPRPKREKKKKAQPQGATKVVREVVIPDRITVRELAERMAVRAGEVIRALGHLGVLATINQALDPDVAVLVVEEFGHVAKRVSEADVEQGLEGAPDRPEDLKPRPPVVTVMGHVDHGKTSLLDALRKTDVAAREVGGITQHIGAYQVDIGSGLPVTFIDTPGHEAFTAMRARGASVTDIVVLVVAADDGVMPQTVEAIHHAQAAKVPIIVAINKIDKPEADPARVKNELLSYDVVVEEFGGEVPCVEVSALKGTGLRDLIELIQLQAELLELKANPDRPAVGTVIEAKLERGRGPIATVLVQNGTLAKGDVVVAGAHWGRARALVDDRGREVRRAGPAMPVAVLGLDGVPQAGDRMVVVESERRAREVAEYRRRKLREKEQGAGPAPGGTLDELLKRIQSGERRELSVIVRADVQGSLEAVRAGLEKLGEKAEEVSLRVLHGAVGAITESDVHLARTTGALIIGFQVRAPAAVRELARREGVEIRYYAIIYELLEDVERLLAGLAPAKEREVVLGHAEIRQVFQVPKVGRVAGCRVTDGLIRRNARIRLLRDHKVIHEGAIASLKRFKEDVREVREGYECGIALEGYQDIREGDVIEAFELQDQAAGAAP